MRAAASTAGTCHVLARRLNTRTVSTTSTRQSPVLDVGGGVLQRLIKPPLLRRAHQVLRLLYSYVRLLEADVPMST